MPDNRQLHSNGGLSNSSNSTAQNIDEAVRRLKLESNDDQDGGATLYPDRPGEPDCIYYLRNGICGYGSSCRFNHPPHAAQGAQYVGELPERVGQPDCGYFMKTGTCKFGSTCKYHHPRDRHGAGPVYLNALGLPMRQEEKSCPYYMRTGVCKFGIACKFHHPQPASISSVLPVSGPPAYGSMGSSIFPSSSLPYMDGVFTGSMPKATYLASSYLQSPQTYMPVTFPPSQGIVSAPGWNTHVGSMSPVPSSNILGDSFSHLPERPDQPECRHFLSTGNCKYGPDCKYHHPREKVAQLASSSLGPLGLPLRPVSYFDGKEGQAVCSYYSMYGLCKYGPTCKFDHPLAGYSYGYNLALPALPIVDQSFSPYQSSPTFHSSQSCPSKSSKFTDCIRKPEAAGNKFQNPCNGPADLSEKAVSLPVSLPASSEHPHDLSD